jgi:CheY-like chemotaxis protein
MAGGSVSEGWVVPTILVADDNSNIQKMVSLVFKEKGVRVVAVGNGEAACRKVPEVQPDVVLADVFMPVRNGYEVCEFVKQDPQFAETPVILLVGAFDPLDEKEAQRVGANGVLKKPFVPPEPLIAMVSSLLKLEPPPPEEPQPTQAAEALSMPPAPEETGPSARQLAIEAARAEYAQAETDETVTTFSAPVAIPASQTQEAEEQDDTMPASEWARRRATMDYKIDTADSAKMVEKLAGQEAAEEPEILASTKHLPFGGANLPEVPAETSPEPPAAKSWPQFAAPELISEEPTVEKAESSPAVAEEFAAAEAGENVKETSLESASQRDPEFTDMADSTPPALSTEYSSSPALEVERVHEAPSPWSAPSSAAEPSTHSDDAIRDAASATWPLPHAHYEQETDTSESYSAPATESHEPEPAPSFTEREPAWQDTMSKMAEPPLALPETIEQEVVEVIQASAVEPEPAEVHPEEPVSKQAVDQATVDDVVAKVLSKLEPQLHQALANGVLRPLVEELLNQQREKK